MCGQFKPVQYWMKAQLNRINRKFLIRLNRFKLKLNATILLR